MVQPSDNPITAILLVSGEIRIEAKATYLPPQPHTSSLVALFIRSHVGMDFKSISYIDFSNKIHNSDSVHSCYTLQSSTKTHYKLQVKRDYLLQACFKILSSCASREPSSRFWILACGKWQGDIGEPAQGGGRPILTRTSFFTSQRASIKCSTRKSYPHIPVI